MKCINCNNAGKCLDHNEMPDLIGCSSGIPRRKKQTNADHIRAMSDEELAMNMMCPNENGLGEIDCDKNDSCNCYECILNWLRSEMEE